MTEPNRIRVMADECAATIQALKIERDAASTEEEKRAIRKRIRMLKGMENWLRTRAGYE